MESKDEEYHQRVRKTFLGLADLEPDRIKLIDGTKNQDEIHKEIVEDFNELVKSFNYKK